MHTASSASLTYLASRSASEYTITAFTPSSRQARWMRRAISPRLATRIFLNIRAPAVNRQRRHRERACGTVASVGNQDLLEHRLGNARLFDDEQGLAELHRLAVRAENLGDGAALVGFDLIEDLHGLDDADGVAFLDLAADLDEGL